MQGHADTVHHASWSADGKAIVTSCEDMYVRVFDMTDVTSREPKFKRIKTSKTPIGAGVGDRADEVGCVMRGKRSCSVDKVTLTNAWYELAGKVRVWCNAVAVCTSCCSVLPCFVVQCTMIKYHIECIVVCTSGIPDTLVGLYAPVKKPDVDTLVYQEQWQKGQVHGKEPVLAVQVVPGAAAQAGHGIIVSCSTKKDVRVYNMQVRVHCTWWASRDAVGNIGRGVELLVSGCLTEELANGGQFQWVIGNYCIDARIGQQYRQLHESKWGLCFMANSCRSVAARSILQYYQYSWQC